MIDKQLNVALRFASKYRQNDVIQLRRNSNNVTTIGYLVTYC